MTNEEDRPPIVDFTVRRAALVHDLRVRLGPACAEWPPELFMSMIEELADITLRYEGLSSVSTYDRRSTERLVADLEQALQRSREARSPDSA